MSSRVADVRARAEQRKAERQQIYQEQVSNCVEKVLRSEDGVMLLNTIASGGRTALQDKTHMSKVVTSIATEVTRTITDSISNFETTCSKRGLTKRRIRYAVNQIYSTYFIEFRKGTDAEIDEVEFEEKLEAVSNKLELEPELWDKLPMLARIEEL